MTPNQNLPVKFADDLTLSIPVKSGASNSNSTANEVHSIFEWTSINRIQLNFKKTWEMLLKGRSTKALPVPLAFIERKPLSTFQSHPCNWDLHFYNILSEAILVVVCTSYVFVNSMDCRWIIFIFLLLVLFYLY